MGNEKYVNKKIKIMKLELFHLTSFTFFLHLFSLPFPSHLAFLFPSSWTSFHFVFWFPIIIKCPSRDSNPSPRIENPRWLAGLHHRGIISGPTRTFIHKVHKILFHHFLSVVLSKVSLRVILNRGSTPFSTH